MGYTHYVTLQSNPEKKDWKNFKIKLNLHLINLK